MPHILLLKGHPNILIWFQGFIQERSKAQTLTVSSRSMKQYMGLCYGSQ